MFGMFKAESIKAINYRLKMIRLGLCIIKKRKKILNLGNTMWFFIN